jgi:hypothetical protein
MTLAERISEVPELYEEGNESTARLLSKSGYLDAPQALTVEDVEQALEQHPELADRWLERGHDQRLSGGWGIECDHGQYKVQSMPTAIIWWNAANCMRWPSSSCAMSPLSAM